MFDKPVQNEAVKIRSAGGCVKPPHVSKAGTADGHAPGEPLEPGEVIGGRTYQSAAPGGLETSDLKYDPLGIGEGVLMGSFHLCSFACAGYSPAACPAADSLAVIRGFRFSGNGIRVCLDFGRDIGFRRNAKQARAEKSVSFDRFMRLNIFHYIPCSFRVLI